MKPKAFNYTAYTDLEADLMIAKAELEQVKAERDAAIALLRNVNWCAGCIHFRGLKGCSDNAISVCDKENDHYQFDYRFGDLQKEEP